MTETLADLVTRGREQDGVFIEVADRNTDYSRREFCTNVWKAANLLGQYGVHADGSVAVAIGPKPDGDQDTTDYEGHPDSADPLLAVLGGALLGARANLTPQTPVDARALVRPAGAAWRARYPTTARCSTLAYGGPPTDAAVAHFEAERWSQNPTAPPEEVTPETPALLAADEQHTHGALLSAAHRLVEMYDLDDSSRIALSADVREPGAFIAGVLAPLLCGGTILLGQKPMGAKDGIEDATLSVGDTADATIVARSVTASLG